MNRAKYLELMTQTYFNTFDECFDDVDFLNYSFKNRKNQFVKLIEREQKSIEKDFGISLMDFIEEFKFALSFLDGQIASNIHEEIKKMSESELNDIRNNDLTIYVPLQRLNSALTGCMTKKDVDYITKCFDSFVSEPRQAKNIKTDEVYKTQNLFKVGLLFATGKMSKYFAVNNKHETVINDGYSAPKIAKELGNDAYDKWILATLNNYSTDNVNGNKNIFNNFDMMTKIIDHCNVEKLTIDTYFKSRLPINKI